MTVSAARTHHPQRTVIPRSHATRSPIDGECRPRPRDASLQDTTVAQACAGHSSTGDERQPRYHHGRLRHGAFCRSHSSRSSTDDERRPRYRHGQLRPDPAHRSHANRPSTDNAHHRSRSRRKHVPAHHRTATDRQGGFATAELAAALPAIILLLLTGLFAVNAVATQTRCADAAREAVLAQARGEDGRAAADRHLPPHAQVDIDTTGDTVTAEVTAQVRPLGSLLPAMTVTGRATAATENQEAP